MKSRYNYFKKLYGPIIKKLTQNEILESIAYAVLIYEDFNRPKIARYMEEIKFRLTKKPHTLGVMQVRTNKVISDKESVKLGTQKIVNAYNKYLETTSEKGSEYFDWYATNYIIQDYNVGTSYGNEINELHNIIKAQFYKDTTDTLDPEKKNAL